MTKTSTKIATAILFINGAPFVIQNNLIKGRVASEGVSLEKAIEAASVEGFEPCVFPRCSKIEQSKISLN